MAHYIYAIENTLNGKVYVGRSAYPDSRWKAHRFPCAKGLLADAMRSDGVTNFTFRILDKCADDLGACPRERFWTHLFESNDPRFGYNDPRVYPWPQDD